METVDTLHNLNIFTTDSLGNSRIKRMNGCHIDYLVNIDSVLYHRLYNYDYPLFKSTDLIKLIQYIYNYDYFFFNRIK